jgi:hypothetical protein
LLLFLVYGITMILGGVFNVINLFIPITTSVFNRVVIVWGLSILPIGYIYLRFKDSFLCRIK